MMRLSTLLLLMMAAPALAQPIPPIEDVDASRLVVIDGDTVWLRCAAAARGCFEKIRIANIDAPELRGARCDGERALAARAGEQLRARLSGPVTIQRCERGAPPRCVDRFGRTLAYLSTQAGDVGSWMIAQGLAEPWRADRAAARARQRAWCGNNG